VGSAAKCLTKCSYTVTVARGKRQPFYKNRVEPISSDEAEPLVTEDSPESSRLSGSLKKSAKASDPEPAGNLSTEVQKCGQTSTQQELEVATAQPSSVPSTQKSADLQSVDTQQVGVWEAA